MHRFASTLPKLGHTYAQVATAKNQLRHHVARLDSQKLVTFSVAIAHQIVKSQGFAGAQVNRGNEGGTMRGWILYTEGFDKQHPEEFTNCSG